jgi:hypothetical protein
LRASAIAAVAASSSQENGPTVALSKLKDQRPSPSCRMINCVKPCLLARPTPLSCLGSKQVLQAFVAEVRQIERSSNRSLRLTQRRGFGPLVSPPLIADTSILLGSARSDKELPKPMQPIFPPGRPPPGRASGLPRFVRDSSFRRGHRDCVRDSRCSALLPPDCWKGRTGLITSSSVIGIMARGERSPVARSVFILVGARYAKAVEESACSPRAGRARCDHRAAQRFLRKQLESTRRRAPSRLAGNRSQTRTVVDQVSVSRHRW